MTKKTRDFDNDPLNINFKIQINKQNVAPVKNKYK